MTIQLELIIPVIRMVGQTDLAIMKGSIGTRDTMLLMTIITSNPKLIQPVEISHIITCHRISAYSYGSALRKTVFGGELTNANNGAVGIEKKQAETARFALLRQTGDTAYRIT